MKWGRGKPEQPEAKPPALDPGAAAGFPRGLPDGDRDRPVAISRWPSTEEIAGLLKPWQPWTPQSKELPMLLLGKDSHGRWYGHGDDRHVLTVAGSRAGKGVSLIVPNLCYWPGSVIAIDPKGELATLTASRRDSEGSDYAKPLTPGEGEVYALDPFGRVTGPAKRFANAAYNPMAKLDPTTGPGQDMASQIADALVIQSTGEGAHWTQSARSLLRGLILYVAAKEPPASRNLITVRRLLTGGEAASMSLWKAMAEYKKEEEAFDPIRRTGHTMLGRGEKETASVVSSAEVQTAFLEGPEMQRVLSNSSFALDDLKAKRVTVYLCLPATRLATHGRWLRMFVTLAMDSMERTGPLKLGQPPVLFCLDEFASLGRMEMVEKAAGLIASFGVKLWTVVQDLTQLQRDYKESWETFMGNAGVLTFHGNTDLTTTENISGRLGNTEVLRTTEQATRSWGQQISGSRVDPMGAFLSGGVAPPSAGDRSIGGGTSINQSLQVAPLLQPSEVMRAFSRATGKLLVMIPDAGPVALWRGYYFAPEEDALFGHCIDPIEGKKSPLTLAERARMGR